MDDKSNAKTKVELTPKPMPNQYQNELQINVKTVQKIKCKSTPKTILLTFVSTCTPRPSTVCFSFRIVSPQRRRCSPRAGIAAQTLCFSLNLG